IRRFYTQLRLEKPRLILIALWLLLSIHQKKRDCPPLAAAPHHTFDKNLRLLQRFRLPCPQLAFTQNETLRLTAAWLAFPDSLGCAFGGEQGLTTLPDILPPTRSNQQFARLSRHTEAHAQRRWYQTRHLGRTLVGRRILLVLFVRNAQLILLLWHSVQLIRS